MTHPLPVTWQQIMINWSCFPLDAGKFLTFLLQVTLFASFAVKGSSLTGQTSSWIFW